MISKALILNGRDGNSLVLDASQFEGDMGDSFSMSVELSPIFVPPTETATMAV